MPEFIALNCHLAFVREGGGITKSGVPAGGSFVDVGNVVEFSIDPQIQQREQVGPVSGRMRRKEIIETGRWVNATWQCNDAGPLFWELLFGTGALSGGSTDFTPGAVVTLRGWLRVQQYDQEGTLKNTLHVFGRLRINGATTLRQGEEPAYSAMFEEIHSTAAEGTLADLS
jgi:hypothetical protein